MAGFTYHGTLTSELRYTSIVKSIMNSKSFSCILVCLSHCKYMLVFLCKCSFSTFSGHFGKNAASQVMVIILLQVGDIFWHKIVTILFDIETLISQ